MKAENKSRRVIRSGKHTTIRDVAELAGTSIATVSYVLNDAKDRYISDELRSRVMEAALQLNYIKSGLASSLKGKQRGVIAVLTPQFENHFFMSVFIAIEKIANQHGYVLSTLNTFDDPARENEVLERMIRIRADGYIIIPTVEGAENTKYIRELGLPFVAVERPLDGVSDYDFISSDNFDAGYALTDHLIRMGHQNIALVYWDTQVTNLHERFAGYRQALLDNGFDYNPDLVKKGDITHEDGARLTEELLNNQSATAIVYGQYILAEGGIKHIHQTGLKIPEDISVVLVGRPNWVYMNQIPFTCVAQPGTQMGEEAAEILLNRIQVSGPQNYVHKKLKCTMFYGESVKNLK